MDNLKPTKTVFTASQYLDWQRSGTLRLNPVFQRRPVWKAAARSQLIDSIIKGYPVPIILLRQVQDLNTLKTQMEVVDGQQRLRTLIAYLDPSALPDFKEEDHAVVINKNHNPEFAKKAFQKLPAEAKRGILGYEFSTHVLPASTGDDQVYKIFARLNSTGLSLTKQEIRNAEYHGEFKTVSYDLGFQYLEQWRAWGVFPNEAIARMEEAEAVSEFLIVMMEGLGGKSQAKLMRYYRDYDNELLHSEVIVDRFNRVMTGLENAFGSAISTSAFRRPALFFSLWVVVYDAIYGLKSPLRKRRPKPLPSGLEKRLAAVSTKISNKRLPDDVQDAMDKATSDPARRRTRHAYLRKELRLA
jgi:hypothetical protein